MKGFSKIIHTPRNFIVQIKGNFASYFEKVWSTFSSVWTFKLIWILQFIKKEVLPKLHTIWEDQPYKLFLLFLDELRKIFGFLNQWQIIFFFRIFNQVFDRSAIAIFIFLEYWSSWMSTLIIVSNLSDQKTSSLGQYKVFLKKEFS